MTREEYSNALYLSHHGIKGQKWGIRRYQDEDGSYTDLGKKRRNENSDSSSETTTTKKRGMSDGAKKALKVGAIAAGSALALYGAYKFSEATHLPSKISETKKKIDDKLSRIKNSETGQAVGKVAKSISESKVGNFVGESARDAGKAMTVAALASAGTIAISKVDQKYADNEADTVRTRDLNKIKRDTIDAGIKTATTVNSSKNSSGNALNISSDLKNKLGSPNKQPINKQSPEWNALFTGLKTDDARGSIRSLASQGYGIDQLAIAAESFRKAGK